MNIKRNLLLSVVMSGAMIGNAFAESKSCRIINWLPNNVYEIKAAINHATHIKLPYKLLTKPIVGNNILWDVDGNGTHIFIKPNNTEDIGVSTTLTAIDKYDNSYQFRIWRVAEGSDDCVTVNDKGSIIPDGEMLSNYQSRDEMQISILEKEISNLKNQIKVLKGANRKAIKSSKSKAKKLSEDALRKYRGSIFSNYKWNISYNNNVVHGVYDDGRWTYIRLNEGISGTALIKGHFNKKEEMLEYKFDEVYNLYRVVGVHDKLTLTLNNRATKIERVGG